VTRSTDAMVEQRRLSADMKRKRVLTELRAAEERGECPSLSALARRAGVNRNWFYRHPDIRAEVEKTAALLLSESEGNTLVTARKTTASTRAELAHAREEIRRYRARVAALELRLSELLGASFLEDLPPERRMMVANSREAADELTRLQQANYELQEELRCREEELTAARSSIRELMVTRNRSNA